MKFTLLFLAVLNLSSAIRAQTPDGQVLANLNWNQVGSYNTPLGLYVPAFTTANIGNQDASDPSLYELNIIYKGNSPMQMKLRSVERRFVESGISGIVTHHYAITGEVSYENVSPGSYLEMWSYFASPAPGYPEGAYFSRALGDSGPMGKLGGTSSWREFWLPFDSTGTTSYLERLEMNLHLTGPGTVHLRKMKLMQYPDAPAEPNVAAPTFPPEQLLSHLLWGNYTTSWQDTTLTMKNPPSPSSWVEIEHTANTPVNAGNIAPMLEVPASFANILPLPKRFGIEGTVACENMVAGSYMEMLCFFAEPSEHAGPLSFNVRVPLEGTDAGHTFALPFDSTKVPTELTNFVLNLHFGGHGKVTLKDVRLVRYDASLPASASPPQIIGSVANPAADRAKSIAEAQASALASVDARHARMLEFVGFCIGIATAFVTLLLVIGGILVSRLWQRRLHERELRRMASLDS